MLINRGILRKLSPSNSARFAPVRLSDRAALIFLGVFVGILAAFGNAAFRSAMDFFTDLFFHRLGGKLGIEMGKRHPLVFLLPATGAAIAGIFVTRFREDAKGYGLPRVIRSMLKKGGLIKKRVIIFNVFLPTLVIGSGGSAGREGPIASLGAALGSALGQYIRAHPGRMRMLVASGAGAAIAAAFDAPIAGMMFALEIILLGNFDIDHFPPLVVSVGTAVVITEALYGREVTFHIPAFSIPSPWVEVPLYAVLGVIIGIASVAFIRLYYFIEDKFESIDIPFYGKLIIGALLTGILGVIFPEVLGNGYEFVEKALKGYYPFVFMGLLGVAKMVATSFTVGSGNPGGLFAPGFFIGAMIAGFFGGILAHILPVHVGSPSAYASVGIGAFIAGTYHAPLTGIFLLFEMTKDYTIILPALFSCVIASLLAEWLFPYTLDTYALHKMGIKVHHGREPEILESIKVKDAMTQDYDVIWEGANLKQIKDYFGKLAKHTDLFVVDKDGKLVGVIPFVILRDAVFAEKELEGFIVAKDLAVTPPVLMEDEPLSSAARKIGSRKIDHLPVIDKNGKLVGMLSRKYIIDAYNREARKRAEERGLS